MKWFPAYHDLMNPTGLKQYESTTGSTGMYRDQDHKVIQLGRNLRKFVRRRLYSLQNTADFVSSWASTWADLSVYKVSSAAEGWESIDTSCSTIHGKVYYSGIGQILEQELREAEECLPLEIHKTWLGKALNCSTCFEYRVKM